MAAFQDRVPSYADDEDFTRSVLEHADRATLTPEAALAAIGEIRGACRERALDLMARTATGRALEGWGEGG